MLSNIHSITNFLTDDENLVLNEISLEAQVKYHNIFTDAFLSHARDYTLRLPRSLREKLAKCKNSAFDCCHISGLDYSEEQLFSDFNGIDRVNSNYIENLRFKYFLICSSFGFPTIAKLESYSAADTSNNKFNIISSFDESSQNYEGYLLVMRLRDSNDKLNLFANTNLVELPNEYKAELFKSQFNLVSQALYSHDNNIASYDSTYWLRDHNSSRSVSILGGSFAAPILANHPNNIITENLSSHAIEALEYLRHLFMQLDTPSYVLRPGEIVAYNMARVWPVVNVSSVFNFKDNNFITMRASNNDVAKIMLN